MYSSYTASNYSQTHRDSDLRHGLRFGLMHLISVQLKMRRCSSNRRYSESILIIVQMSSAPKLQPSSPSALASTPPLFLWETFGFYQLEARDAKVKATHELLQQNIFVLFFFLLWGLVSLTKSCVVELSWWCWMTRDENVLKRGGLWAGA